VEPEWLLKLNRFIESSTAKKRMMFDWKYFAC